jgi:TolB-like protein
LLMRKKQRVLSLLAIIVFIVLPVWGIYAQQELPVLSVLEFEAVGVSKGETKLFADLVSSYFVKSANFRVIDAGQRDAILKELEFSLSGCTDETCQLEAGKMLSAQYIVVGSLGLFGERYVLNIKLINVESGQTENSASRVYLDLNALVDDAQAITALLTGSTADSTGNNQAHFQTIRVSTVSGFLKAIGPNRTIILEPGSYRLEEHRDLTNNSKIKWDDNFDGYYPSIRNVTNMTISGSESGKTEIIIQPQYGWVLEFFNCREIRLRNLTLGHLEQGACLGGVVNLIECDDISIENCDLYGSGTVGIAAATTSNLSVLNSIIRECSYALLEFNNSEGILFSNTKFLKTGEYNLISFTNTHEVKLSAANSAGILVQHFFL